MKKLLARLSLLLSPAAIGIYLTCAFTWVAHNYFVGKDSIDSEKLGSIEQFLITAHQKSVDFRLKDRGERAGSPLVGILTVDEKAVATVGRWPWPRETTARAIDNAVKLGAKVLAFDIVFSEPSAQPLAEAYQAVSQKAAIPPNLQELFVSEMTQRNSDAALAQVFAEDSNSLVLGSFGNPDLASRGPFFDFCHDLLFSHQPEYAQWATKERSAIINLSSPPQIPEALKMVYNEKFNEIRDRISSIRNPKNAIERLELREEINNEQLSYCQNWLNPHNDPIYATIDENWNAIASAEGPELIQSYPTFTSWIQSLEGTVAEIAVPRVNSWTMNLPMLTEKAEGTHTGYFNAFPDADGSVRRSNIVMHTGSAFMPSIGFKAFLVGNNYNAQIKLAKSPITNRFEVEKLTVINEEGDPVFNIPVNASGQLAINYAGRQKIFPYLSLAELLSDSEDLTYTVREYDPKSKSWGEVDKKAKKKDFLKDKFFIVGATAVGIYDLRVTPFEENFPGVETHANVLDNLIRRDFLVTNPNEEILMQGGLLVLGLILSFSLTFLSALPSLSLASILFLGLGLVDKYYWFGQGIVVTIVLPLSLILILFIVLISYKYLVEERGKREMRSTFQKYVSPAIVEEILSDPSKIELGGRKARVTVFFSDVRGFTTISEKLDPRALSDLLNEYLTPMTDLVFKNRGTLDKYMGDAIMAFFGAPIPYADHAKFACRCALQNLTKLYELQAEFKAKGLPEIDVGIGLNTGEVSVGNMGSQTVRSYTVMGDAVNLASRLEGINKQYGTRIIISEFTYADVKDSFICREVDRVRVKGKVLPVKIFELIAEGKTDTKVAELLKNFDEGYSHYHQKLWDKALKNFERALNIQPADPVTKLYIERCQEYLTTPPPEDWDGVFVMKTK